MQNEYNSRRPRRDHLLLLNGLDAIFKDLHLLCVCHIARRCTGTRSDIVLLSYYNLFSCMKSKIKTKIGISFEIG